MWVPHAGVNASAVPSPGLQVARALRCFAPSTCAALLPLTLTLTNTGRQTSEYSVHTKTQ
jgi:hypothetical protein